MDAAAKTVSLVDLKVEELLKEVRVDYPADQAVESLLSLLRECLSQIPAQEVNSSLAPAFVQGLGVPPEKARFRFTCSDSVGIVGSFASRTMAKPEHHIDITVSMPKSCFHQKDFLNYRYHAKRALYLVAIKKHLSLCSFVRNTKWNKLHHDGRKPVLLIELVEGLGINSSFSLRLIPVIAPGIFDASKLAPSRNNIKFIVRTEQGIRATPNYNSTIMEDMNMHQHCSYLKTAALQINNFRDSLLLLKVWMRQRLYTAAPDSLNGFLLSILFAHYVNTNKGRFVSNLGPFQIFRMFMEALGSGHFLKNGLFMHTKNLKADKEMKQLYLGLFEVVVVDSLNPYNIFFRMKQDAWDEIKLDAHNTLSAMKNTRDFAFDEVFMTLVDWPIKFDYHLRILPVDYDSKSQLPIFEDEERTRGFESHVRSILVKGLGDRVDLIRIYHRISPSEWNIEKDLRVSESLPVYAGINMRSFETAYRMVDVGPHADNKEEAAKFRAFWGEKAELRRFKDGTINETAVWECDPLQRHLIPYRIIEHILTRHLPLSSQNLYIVAGQLDFSLSEGRKGSSASVHTLLEAYEAFSKRLRSLEDLPLKISSIQPLSAAFRYAAVFPPSAHILADERSAPVCSTEWVPTCIEPLEVMVQLEGSGRWPSDSIAIGKTKVAFSLKIAESMNRLYGVKIVTAEDSVDLLMHGFCFRLKVYYDKDPTFAQTRHDKQQHGPRVSSHGGKADHTEALLNDLLLRSLHSSMLNGLQGQYPIYGPTVRLAKRWVASHLFSDVICDEAVELLVAYVFLRPAPYTAPLSRISGFMRFLQFLVKFNWELSPLIVDLNEDFTQAELNCILDEFHNARKLSSTNGTEKTTEGGPAMFIATPYDLQCCTWTRESPTHLTLKRLIAFAKTTLDLMKRLVKGEMQERWPSLFQTPLHLYDIVLKVQADKLAYPLRLLALPDIKTNARVVVKSARDDFVAWLPTAALHHGQLNAEKHLLIGFDPTKCFLTDIKEKFGNVYTLWYDTNGGGIIGLSVKAKQMQGPGNKRQKLENLTDDMLVDIAQLGEGFIESVHVVEI